jgi:hypothetical protein
VKQSSHLRLAQVAVNLHSTVRPRGNKRVLQPKGLDPQTAAGKHPARRPRRGQDVNKKTNLKEIRCQRECVHQARDMAGCETK